MYLVRTPLLTSLRFLVAALAILSITQPAAANDVVWQAPATQLSTGTLAVFPDVAYDDKHNVYLVVWGDSPAAWGRFMNPDGTAIGTAFRISNVECQYGQSPRVAYSSGAPDDVFLVTFSTASCPAPRNKNVFGQLVRFTGSGGALVGGSVPLATTSFTSTIQTAGGVTWNAERQEFAFTWDEYRNGDYDAWFRAFPLTRDGSGVVTGVGTPGAEINLSASPGAQGLSAIAFDPGTDNYMVVFQGNDPATGAIGTFGRIVNANTLATSDFLRVSVGGYQREPTVIFLPQSQRFLVLWSDIPGSQSNVAGRLVVPGTGANDGNILPVIAGPMNEGYPGAAWSNSAQTAFVAAMHDDKGLWAVELNGSGVATRAAFKASTVASANGLYTPRIAAGIGAQFVMAYQNSYVETWAERYADPTGGCTPVISPTSATAGSGGGSGTVTITGPPGCAWTASSNAAWITITSPTSGSGNGSVTYGVAANTTGAQRVGTLTVGGQAVTITQLAATRTGDFDGDGKSDLAVFRPGNGSWHVQHTGGAAASAMIFGGPGDVPASADFNGDGRADYAIFRPSNGTWHIPGQGVIQWGMAGDVPVPADYDGDGRADIAVFRPSNGFWYVRGQFTVQFGVAGDVPVPADYDGNRTADVAVFRPANGYWYVRNQSLTQWGTGGDLPVPADYNGDGRADFAVYRPSLGRWFVRNIATVDWGLPADVPLAMDVDGDGRAELTTFRRDNGYWYRYNLAAGSATMVPFGQRGDIPAYPGAWFAARTAPADFDGDRRSDPTIFRPSIGWWQIVLSSQNQQYFTGLFWGQSGDLEAAGDFLGTGRSQAAVYRPSTFSWHIQGLPTIYFGWPDAIPVQADYDGDGITDIAYFRHVTGQFAWLKSSSGFVSSDTHIENVGGLLPVVGDFDGDGVSDWGYFNPATGDWKIRRSTTGQFWTFSAWGAAADVPVVADYDNDGRADLALFRPSTTEWLFRLSSLGFGPVAPVVFGLSTDRPVPANFVGDGRVDVAVYRPGSSGSFSSAWYVLGGFSLLNGDPGDVPVQEPPRP